MHIGNIPMLNYWAPLTLTTLIGQPGVEGGQHSSQSFTGDNSGMGLLDTAEMPANATRATIIEVKFISKV